MDHPLQTELTNVIRWFHSKGWAPATSSNYSFRNPVPHEKTLTISRSGVDKAHFCNDDFMTVDMEGRPVAGFENIKPSAETRLHTMLYDLHAETGCVLHTHTPLNTALSRRFVKKGFLDLSGYEILKGLEGVKTHDLPMALPIFANSQDIPALSVTIQTHLRGQANPPPGFLLSGHGLYAWGKTIAAAKRHVEVWEFLLECESISCTQP
ncbi:MAG: methylthioribulose 1-phosphate dehydratase [Verrucomicrobiae bacterium]|nr:methylthioribulose 1-phosphate dehydratase [Verrucomicrobiae bacterium]